MASIHAQSDDETARILNRGHPSEAPAALHWFASWSVGDWLATLAVGCFGLWADSLPPFMRDIGPQLNDPTIAYPHTKADAQQYPTWLLFRLSIWLPLLLVTMIGMTASSMRRAQLLAELWLGLAGSITFAFALICTVKAAVGRLRPDFLARCVPVGGLCTGAADVILEGRRSFPSGRVLACPPPERPLTAIRPGASGDCLADCHSPLLSASDGRLGPKLCWPGLCEPRDWGPPRTSHAMGRLHLEGLRCGAALAACVAHRPLSPARLLASLARHCGRHAHWTRGSPRLVPLALPFAHERRGSGAARDGATGRSSGTGQ